MKKNKTVREVAGMTVRRDFIAAVKETDGAKDWHRETEEREKLVFPNIVARPLTFAWQTDGAEIQRNAGLSVLVSEDDGQRCGKAFDPSSFIHLLPAKGMEMAEEALKGTDYRLDRIGMLKNRSVWFMSYDLKEFATVARKGESFRLNFSGALDGSMSPEAELNHLRITCFNSLMTSRAMGQKLFRVKQTLNSPAKYPRIVEIIDNAVGMIGIFNAALNQFDETPATIQTARELYAGEIVRAGGSLVSASVNDDGSQRASKALGIVDGLSTLFVRGDGNKGETMGDVLNGFTQWFTRGGGENSRKDVWTAVESSEIGGNGRRKADFFATLRDEKARKELQTIGRKALKEAKATAFELATN